MKVTDLPEAFGVFKPVGYVVVAFPSSDDASNAVKALEGEGFPDAEMLVYTPKDMIKQADIDIANAGVLASIGQELNLVKAHRELAENGYSFIVVKAPEDDRAQLVADVALRFHAARAQKYGRLIIEELIDVGSNERQVGESPDRGLDAQTRSGEEPDAPGSRR